MTQFFLENLSFILQSANIAFIYKYIYTFMYVNCICCRQTNLHQHLMSENRTRKQIFVTLFYIAFVYTKGRSLKLGSDSIKSRDNRNSAASSGWKFIKKVRQTFDCR